MSLIAVPVRVRAWAAGVTNSYWFLPGLMAIAGLVVGQGLVYIDALLGDGWLGNYAWISGNRPEGARSMLSTIAGSTITVAGVVFSITLAAVTYASGQYGPRLLLNFQRDRGNQASLGVFLATFVYCLVVLRTIRSASEASVETEGLVSEGFVPHIAMFGALLLALASIGVLVYFVHHVTDGIHINNAIARIGKSLLRGIRERGPAPSPPDHIDDREFCELVATATGYIEAVDRDALRVLARDQDLTIVLLKRPGDFVHRGRPLLKASPPGKVPDELSDACKSAFAISRRRSPMQDLRFAIDELVEIAARALSPGVNDPFTAISCIDWLGAAMSELDRDPVAADPEDAEKDAEDIRLFEEPLDFDDYLQAAFVQLRSYVAADPNARIRTLSTLDEVAAGLGNPAHRAAVMVERERLSNLPLPG